MAEQLKARHFPGFDSLRCLAATLVIYSHAFVLALSGGEIARSAIAEFSSKVAEYSVYVFFIISGFLLARSLAAKPDSISYGVNRGLRILPGFFLYTLVTGLLIGPIFTEAPLRDYFADYRTYGFFRWGIDSLADSILPGVFAYQGELSAVVNGSLWSLHYEALSYILLLAVWLATRRATPAAVIFLILSVLVVVSKDFSNELKSIGHTLPYFAGGVVMSAVYDYVRPSALGVFLGVAIFAIASYLGYAPLTFSVVGPYVAVYIGERGHALSGLIAKYGDLSYGLYLYGWPCEQIVVQMTGTRNPWVIFLASFIPAAALAFLSFHLVEKRAMMVRKSVARSISARCDEILGGDLRSRRFALAGARLAFMLCSVGILLSGSQWWFVLESTGIIILSAAAGAGLGYIVGRSTGPRITSPASA